MIGLNMLTLWDAKGSLDEYIEPLPSGSTQGGIRPVVAEAFPLERGADAHRFMQERRNVGKVVLDVCRLDSPHVVPAPTSDFSFFPPSGGITRGGRRAASQGERR